MKIDMAVNEILNIRPSIESLCSSVKGRPKLSCKTNVKKIYNCPVSTCKYYKDSSFSKIKFLKQHYVKVHLTKIYSCSKCQKSFALETMLQRHQSICGIQYRCFCNTQFTTYEAFLTHAKRKNHGSSLLRYKEMMACIKMHTAAQKFQKYSDNTLKVEAIIVEDSPQQKFLILNKKQTSFASSKETQTGMKMCKILPKVSSQTQTVEEKSVSLQTSYPKRRRKSKNHGLNAILSSQRVSFSTSSTQTTPIKEDIKEKLALGECTPSIFEDSLDYSNSSLRFMDKKLLSFTDPVLGSSFCSNYDDKSCSIENEKRNERPNDINVVLYSNSETQTAFEDYFDNSCMDTYTQTCDSLFSDLNFVDIQTQTSWSIFDDDKGETKSDFCVS